jgi:hypothetical protein
MQQPKALSANRLIGGSLENSFEYFFQKYISLYDI